MNPLDVCLACNTAMLPVEPDQITHPCCDPDDTPLPALNEYEIAELLGDLDWLRQQSGRCTGCGYHPATQGHAADCNSKAAAVSSSPAAPVLRLRRTRQPSRSAETWVHDCSRCPTQMRQPFQRPGGHPTCWRLPWRPALCCFLPLVFSHSAAPQWSGFVSLVLYRWSTAYIY